MSEMINDPYLILFESGLQQSHSDNVPVNLSLVFLSQEVRDINNSIKIITGSDIARYAANVK